jgi:hypothetical protein
MKEIAIQPILHQQSPCEELKKVVERAFTIIEYHWPVPNTVLS